MNKEELEKLYHLLNDLGWEYQRMSTDGQTTLNEIYAMVGIEPNDEGSVERNMRAMPDDIEYEKNVFINRIHSMIKIPEYHEEDSISLMDLKEDLRRHLYGDGGKNE